jgi:hypothetical protein
MTLIWISEKHIDFVNVALFGLDIVRVWTWKHFERLESHAGTPFSALRAVETRPGRNQCVWRRKSDCGGRAIAAHRYTNYIVAVHWRTILAVAHEEVAHTWESNTLFAFCRLAPAAYSLLFEPLGTWKYTSPLMWCTKTHKLKKHQEIRLAIFL